MTNASISEKAEELKFLLERYSELKAVHRLPDGRVSIRKQFVCKIGNTPETKEQLAEYLKGYCQKEGIEYKSGMENRVIRFTASTETKDRDGDIIEVAGWDFSELIDNPVFLAFHDYRSWPLGQIIRIIKDISNAEIIEDVLFADRETSEEAEKAFRLYKGKFVRAVSVGFKPLEWERIIERDEQGNERVTGIRFKKQKQIELSGVPIPSNPEALARSFEDAPQNKEWYGDIDILTKQWTEAEQKIWDETENEIRFRMRNPNDFESDSFRRIAIKRDKPRVFAIVGRLKGEQTTTMQALRFPKEDGWTVTGAKEWMRAHPDMMRAPDVLEIAEKLLEELAEIKVMVSLLPKIKTESAETPDAKSKGVSQVDAKKEENYIAVILAKTKKLEEQKKVT